MMMYSVLFMVTRALQSFRTAACSPGEYFAYHPRAISILGDAAWTNGLSRKASRVVSNLGVGVSVHRVSCTISGVQHVYNFKLMWWEHFSHYCHCLPYYSVLLATASTCIFVEQGHALAAPFQHPC